MATVPLSQAIRGLMPGFLGSASTATPVQVYDATAAQIAAAQQFNLAMQAQHVMTGTTTSTTGTGLIYGTYPGTSITAASTGMGFHSGYGGAQVAAQRAASVAVRRRLKETNPWGSKQYEWADFWCDADCWCIASRTDKDGNVTDYRKTHTPNDLIIHEGNKYLERIRAGEGIHNDDTYYYEGGAGGPEPQKTTYVPHEEYTKLVARVDKIEKVLGLNGETKSSDLLLALAERVQEIEDYLENRA